MKKTKPNNNGLLSAGKILMVPQAHYGIAEKPMYGIGMIAAKLFEGAALILTRPKSNKAPFRVVLGFLDYFDHNVEGAAQAVIQAFGDNLTSVTGAVFVKKEDDYFFLKPIKRALENAHIEKSGMTQTVIAERGAVHVGVHLKTGKLLCGKGFDTLCHDKDNLVDYCDILQRVHHKHIHGDRRYIKGNVLGRQIDIFAARSHSLEDYEVRLIDQAFDLSGHALGVGAKIVKNRKRLVFTVPI